MMPEREAKMLHFEHCVIGAPALDSHAIGRDHHPRAILAKMAVHKYLFPRIVLEQFQELYEDVVVGRRTVPRDGDVPHAEAAYVFSLATGSSCACVNHHINAHFRQRFKSFLGWLRAAKERGRDFAKIANSLDRALLAEYVRGRNGRGAARILLSLGVSNRGRQQEHGREESKAAKLRNGKQALTE